MGAYWSHARLGPIDGINRVQPCSLAGGALEGVAFERVFDLMTSLIQVKGYELRHGRSVLAVYFSQCPHILPTTAEAFIEHAFRRLKDPKATPPAAPPMELPDRTVSLRVTSEAKHAIHGIDVAWRHATGGDFSEPVRLTTPFQLTVPRADIQLRVGHARTQDGGTLPLLAADVHVGATQRAAECPLTEAATVRVRVVDEAGRPVEGAAVQTLSRPIPRMNIQVVVMGEVAPEQPPATPPEVGDGLGRTDAEGRIRLPVPADKPSLLRVRKDGQAMPVDEELPPGTEEHEVLLTDAWTLRLLVVDAEGLPIRCDAVVQNGKQKLRGESDETGRLTIGPMPRRTIALKLEPDRGFIGHHADAWHDIEPTGEVVRRSLPCRQIDIHVTDADGAPVPRYWLSLWSPSNQSGTSMTIRGETRIAVPLTLTKLKVSKAKDAEDRPLNLQPSATYVKEDTKRVSLRLQPGRTLRGVVLDTEGKPVADAEVWARLDGDAVSEVKTDAQGRFELQGLDHRRVTLKVRPPAPHAPLTKVDVPVEDGAPPIELRLLPAVAITIMSDAGELVPHAYVQLWGGPGGHELMFEAHTDDSGRVYFPNIGGRKKLRISMQNGEPFADATEGWDGKPHTIRLRIARTLQFLVVDSNGPVRDAEIEIEGHEVHYQPTNPAGRVKVRYVPAASTRARARRSPRAAWGAWTRIRPASEVTRIELEDAGR